MSTACWQGQQKDVRYAWFENYQMAKYLIGFSMQYFVTVKEKVGFHHGGIG